MSFGEGNKLSLRAAADFYKGKVTLRPLPKTPRLTAVSKNISDQFNSVPTPPKRDLNASQVRLHHAILSKDFQQASDKDWRLLPWCVWGGDQPLVDIPATMDVLDSYAKLKPRRTLIKAMIENYLVHFDASSDATMKLGKIIRSHVDKWNWIWSENNSKYEMFSAEHCAHSLAELLFKHTQSMSPLEILRSRGLSSRAIRGGVAASSYLQYLRQVERNLGEESRSSILVNRVFEWSFEDQNFVYPAYKADLVNALLKPWLEHSPAEELRETIEETLLRYFKDPRINRSSWTGVSEEALTVIKRWLSQAALSEFIEVVSRTADASEWEYRKAFWEAYIEAGAIDDAWVAFGPQARQIAQAAFGDRKSQFGKLATGSGNNMMSNHSALLLKIGGLTIVDWSHNGGYRVWNENNPNAPKLYQQYRRHDRGYDKYDLQKVRDANSDFDGAHQGSEWNSWQVNLSNYIANKTGIRIPIRSVPRRRSWYTRTGRY